MTLVLYKTQCRAMRMQPMGIVENLALDTKNNCADYQLTPSILESPPCESITTTFYSVQSHFIIHTCRRASSPACCGTGPAVVELHIVSRQAGQGHLGPWRNGTEERERGITTMRRATSTTRCAPQVSPEKMVAR